MKTFDFDKQDFLVVEITATLANIASYFADSARPFIDSNSLVASVRSALNLGRFMEDKSVEDAPSTDAFTVFVDPENDYYSYQI